MNEVATAARLARIEVRIAELRGKLLTHPVYARINHLDALRRFMEHHVFAVWDFMSLLKALQRRLTCVDLPWTPALDATHARLINAIVLAEETDEDRFGGYASHFELYHRSMVDVRADVGPIDGLIARLRSGVSLAEAMASPEIAAEIPTAARPFVESTFRVIDQGELVAIMAAFTFGREDLLPEVFQRIVDELDQESGGELAELKYYLLRHIGLDGDEHGPMAHRLLASLCGDDEMKWKIAEDSAVECLQARLQLWNGIDEAIISLGPEERLGAGSDSSSRPVVPTA